MHRSVGAAVTALLMALALPGVALADAELVSAVPAPDSTIIDVPDEIVLTFNEPLSDRSSITVLDAGGTTVATGALDPADATVLRGALSDLEPGPYVVQWVADSADGHLARDTYRFTVAAPTTSPVTPTLEPSAPSASPAPTPSAAASPSPTSDGGTGSDGVDVVIPIVAALVFLGAALWWLLRRR